MQLETFAAHTHHERAEAVCYTLNMIINARNDADIYRVSWFVLQIKVVGVGAACFRLLLTIKGVVSGAWSN